MIKEYGYVKGAEARGKGFTMPSGSLSTMVLLLVILTSLQVSCSSLGIPFLTNLLMGVLW